MTSRWWGPSAAAVAVAGIATAGVLTSSPAPPAAAPQAAQTGVDAVTLVCPMVGGNQSEASTDVTMVDAGPLLPSHHQAGTTVSYGPLTPAQGRSTAQTLAPAKTLTDSGPWRTMAVTVTGPAAATVAADQTTLRPKGHSRSLVQTPCVAPATDWWFVGAEGRVGYYDWLFVANPDDVAANITVTAWSHAGPLEPPKLQSVIVAPHTSQRLAIADHLPDAAYLGIHVHTNSGRVSAALLDVRIFGLRSGGADWIPATARPARRMVIPGFTSGDGHRWLIVANPGAAAATVGIRLSTPDGNFVPASNRGLTVAARHSALVDLASAFDGQPGAAILTSDVPVVATGQSQSVSPQLAPDIQWQPVAAPLDGYAVLPHNAPPFGTSASLRITAPGDAAKVLVSSTAGGSTTIDVRAGRSVVVDLASLLPGQAAVKGALVLSRAAGGDVYVSRSLFFHGAHGQLIASELPIALPAPLVLPPVVYDPRVATP